MDFDIEGRRRYRNTIMAYENHKRKLKFSTFKGTLIIAASLAAELFGSSVAKPMDVGYIFTSDDVSITQTNPDDYTTKEYNVRDSNGTSNHFTFAELESIAPSTDTQYTGIPQEHIQGNTHIGIARVENNPVKKVIDGSAIMGFIAGTALAGSSLAEIREVNKEEESFKQSRRR